MFEVTCRSGLQGWRARLQNVYSSREEWRRFANVYNLAERLGYGDADEAWDDDPVVEGSVKPSDYRRVK